MLDNGRDDKNCHADQPSPSHGLQDLTQVLSLGTESELAYLNSQNGDDESRHVHSENVCLFKS